MAHSETDGGCPTRTMSEWQPQATEEIKVKKPSGPFPRKEEKSEGGFVFKRQQEQVLVLLKKAFLHLFHTESQQEAATEYQLPAAPRQAH